MDTPPRVDIDDLLAVATQRLLGDTLTLSDDQWLAPSRLPGWTRGHVATHLSRNADALARVIESNLAGSPLPMYDSEDERDEAIEVGAGRPGLEQQVDLDESANRVSQVLARVPAERLDEAVTMRGSVQMPLGMLGTARLAEVVLHHVDLDTGFELAEADPAAIAALLDYWAYRTRAREDFPAVRLVSDSGTWTFGTGNDPAEVRGEPADLLAWATGRAGGAVNGAENLDLPPIA